MSAEPATETGPAALADTVDTLAGARWEEIRFRRADGPTCPDIADLVTPDTAVSARGLAALFANPAQDLAFSPVTVWSGIEIDRRLRPWRSPVGEPDVDLVGAFAEAVDRAIGDSACVGLSFSGGLDSLLVAVAVDRALRGTGRRLVVAVADLVDDHGDPCAVAARALVERFDLDAEVVVVPEVGDPSPAAWSLLGPRGDALPEVNARIADALAAAGADRVLVGSGADEVLHVGSFIGPALLRNGRRQAVRPYLSDLRIYSGLTGFGREVAAGLAPRMSPDRAFGVAFSVMFPGIMRAVPAGVLHPDRLDEVVQLRQEWVRTERRLFEASDYDWSDYAALHAVCPRPLIPAANHLPVYSPFTDPGFSAVAEQVPLHRRYDETLGSAYHRMKGLVVGLFPAELRGALPDHKQTFGRALARAAAAQAEPGYPLSREADVLADGAEAVLAGHDDLRLTAGAVEQWLHGAADRGYPVSR